MKKVFEIKHPDLHKELEETYGYKVVTIHYQGRVPKYVIFDVPDDDVKTKSMSLGLETFKHDKLELVEVDDSDNIEKVFGIEIANEHRMRNQKALKISKRDHPK